MKQNYAMKIRIYPTINQLILINKTIGCNRLLYNLMLAEHKEVYEKLKDNKEELYKWKYKTIKEIKDENDFMYEVDSQSYMHTKIHLDKAFQNFYKSLKTNNNFGFPKFKKKQSCGSYTTSQVYKTIYFNDKNHIKLPKLGKVKYRDKRLISNDKIKSATISKDCCNKYFVSILFEKEIEEVKKVELNQQSKVIGLDMSLTSFYIDSDENKPNYSKRYKKNEKKLKRLQHIESREKKDSNRKKKLRYHINLLNFKIKNQRNDFIHQLSKKLVNQNDVIVIEDLDLKEMEQNFGKSINDLAWNKFISCLKYKSEWYGKYLIQVNKYFPSSKLCSNCSFKNNELTLFDREWQCPNCGVIHDRDINSAINLRKQGYDLINNYNKGEGLVLKYTQRQPVTASVKCINEENDLVYINDFS